MIGVKVRDDHRIDIFRSNTGCLHACGCKPCCRSQLPTGSRVHQNGFTAGLYHGERKLYRYGPVVETGIAQCLLCLIDANAFDKVLIVRFLPDAIIKRDDFCIRSDFVAVKAFVAYRGCNCRWKNGQRAGQAQR